MRITILFFLAISCGFANTLQARQVSIGDFFQDDRVTTVDIQVDEDDWDTIRYQSRSFEDELHPRRQFEPIAGPYTYVPAQVTINGVDYGRVKIRKKGFFGSQNSERPSLKVKLDAFQEDANIGGLTNLTFNNNNQDRSLMSQFLGYRLFEKAGVPVPRSGYAKVTVNGKNLGVYTHVETLRKPALRRGFGNDNGTLYEGTVVDFHEGWEGSFERKLGSKNAGRDKIKAVIDALLPPPGAILIGNEAEVRARVPSDGREDAKWFAAEYDDRNWIVGRNGAGFELQSGYEDLICEELDMEGLMRGVETSLQLRMPFKIDDLKEVRDAKFLQLRVKCDDGFIAYLNGEEIARHNAPDRPKWNSRATSPTGDESAREFMSKNITSRQDLLLEGENILAIQVFNIRPDSSDLLMVVEMQYSNYDLESALWDHVDEDAFYTFWAMEGLVNSWDGYSGNRNNFFIYLNPETDRLHFMPWGIDALFEQRNPLKDWNGENTWEKPISALGQGLIANQLYRIPEARERYAEEMDRLLTAVWDEDALFAKARSIQSLLEPHLSANQKWDVDFNHIRGFIRDRREKVENELSRGMPEYDFPMDGPAVMPPGEFKDRDWDDEDQDSDQEGEFMMAATHGKIDELKGLLEAGLDVNMTGDDGTTALSLAALANQVEAIELLLARGADVNVTNDKDDTPLHAAAFFGSLDALELLIAAGADVNARNANGESPLDVCSVEWSQELRGIVEFVNGFLRTRIDAETVREQRPLAAELIREHGGQ